MNYRNMTEKIVIARSAKRDEAIQTSFFVSTHKCSSQSLRANEIGVAIHTLQ
jgi:hypothetical protein